MKLKQLLTVGLAGTLLVGTIATSSAAEFDAAWYAKQNPDVVAEVGDSPEALKLHYDMYGRKEARMANTKDVEAQLRRLFNVDEYAKLYPDVKEFYGEDVEAMFMHYISYGLLEARRPSEKVSQAVATSLKKAVEKALTDAGVAVAPGSAELVAVITGESAALVEAKPELALDTTKLEEVTKALEQVTVVVEKAVTETVKEVNDPAPVQSSGGGGGGSTDSSKDKPQTTTPVLRLRVTGKTLFARKTASGGAYTQVTDSNVNDFFHKDVSGNIVADSGSEFASDKGSVTYTEISGNTLVSQYVEYKATDFTVNGSFDGVVLEKVTLNAGNVADYFTGATYSDGDGVKFSVSGADIYTNDQANPTALDQTNAYSLVKCGNFEFEYQSDKTDSLTVSGQTDALTGAGLKSHFGIDDTDGKLKKTSEDTLLEDSSAVDFTGGHEKIKTYLKVKTDAIQIEAKDGAVIYKKRAANKGDMQLNADKTQAVAKTGVNIYNSGITASYGSWSSSVTLSYAVTLKEGQICYSAPSENSVIAAGADMGAYFDYNGSTFTEKTPRPYKADVAGETRVYFSGGSAASVSDYVVEKE